MSIRNAECLYSVYNWIAKSINSIVEVGLRHVHLTINVQSISHSGTRYGQAVKT